MRYQVVVGVLLIVAFGAPLAKADLVDQTTYTINFTGTPPLPPAGSFTYDPDTKVFTNFFVTWNGSTFDLTSSANSLVIPPVYLFCLDNSTPITPAFDFMKGSCSPPPDGYQIYWAAIAEPPAQGGFPVPGWKTFGFYLTNNSGIFLYIQASADYSGSAYVTASGQWTTAASASAADNLIPSPSPVPLINGSGTGTVTGSSTLSNLGNAGTTFTISSTTQTGGAWLNASTTTNSIGPSGSLPVTITADTSQLIPGSYTGTVKVTGIHSFAAFTVNLTVTGVQMSVSPSSIILGTVQPQQRSTTAITVSSSGMASLAITVATNPGQGSGWLTTDTTQITANPSATFHVTVDPTSLNPGTYMGTISVRCTAAPCIEVSAPVTFTVPSPSPRSFIGSMPQINAEENWTTTITLVNKGTTAADAQLNLFGDAADPGGNGPMTLPLMFPQLASSPPLLTASLQQTISPNASSIIETAGPQTPPVLVGSAQLAASGAVDGFAMFHLIPGAQEAVVPMETRNANSYVLAFDETGGVVLGVAVENVSSQPATIPVVIRDDTGMVIGSPGATLSIAGNGHTSFVLSTLYPVTDGKRGTIEFDTPAGGQISVLGIRTTPLGSSTTLTTIPALANLGTNGGSIAHIATGNGWQTTFVIVNAGTTVAQAHLKFFKDNGSPLAIPIGPPGGAATSTSSTVDQTLAAGATLIVQSAAPQSDPAPTIGSAQLTTDGNVGGFVIFRYNPNGQEAVVPLESRNANTSILAFDNTSGTATGVAINSVSTQSVNIPVIVRDDTGIQIATDTITLAANGHLAFTLGVDMYPGARGIRGTIEFDTPAGAQIGALGIRIPIAHTFTTLPALVK